MAKVKLTKNELKSQRDDLKRFQRYLPTLQLKKQQLQMEVRGLRSTLAELDSRIEAFRQRLDSWLKLLSDPQAKQLNELLVIENWKTAVRNVAGIDTPAFESLEFKQEAYNLFDTPLWFDDALDAVKKTVDFRLRRQLLQEQLTLIERELRTVTQRVNLFEKVKIPEAHDNIKRIQIYLGDQQTNAVGRAKIAKEKARRKEL